MSGKPEDQAGGEEEPEITEPIPGIRALPLRTPTLPPARHTNTYLVGEERLLIVDPATYEGEERDKLLDHVERRIARGARVEAVVLTHHHVDHIGAATWLSDQLQAPIAAHPITKDLVEKKIPVTRTLVDGEVLDLGRGFQVEVLHTPGHAPGHIVLRDLRPDLRADQRGSMIVGDMVAGVGTIIIDPPEGDMAIYLRELARLRNYPNTVLLPAHGPPQLDGHAKLDQYIAHRLKREAKIFDALKAENKASTPYDLLPRAYDDTPLLLYGLAARSCLAHLIKLTGDGKARQNGEYFIPS